MRSLQIDILLTFLLTYLLIYVTYLLIYLLILLMASGVEGGLATLPSPRCDQEPFVMKVKE